MEFKIKRSDLLRCLRWTQGVVERKTTMPVLAKGHIEGEGKNLILTATDLEIAVRISCPAEVLEPGKIVVNAKSLYEIVKELADEGVKFRGEAGKRLEILSGRSEFKIVAMRADDFPNVMGEEKPKFAVIEGSLLMEMIDKTAYAVSTDETRYVLSGVFLEGASEGGLRMVATDGHRLSYVDRPIGNASLVKKGVIIPRKGVQELKKLLGEGTGEFQLSLGDKNII